MNARGSSTDVLPAAELDGGVASGVTGGVGLKSGAVGSRGKRK